MMSQRLKVIMAVLKIIILKNNGYLMMSNNQMKIVGDDNTIDWFFPLPIMGKIYHFFNGCKYSFVD